MIYFSCLPRNLSSQNSNFTKSYSFLSFFLSMIVVFEYKYVDLSKNNKTQTKISIRAYVVHSLGNFKIAKICTLKNTQKFNKNCSC